MARLARDLADLQEDWRVFEPRGDFLEVLVAHYERLMGSDAGEVLVADLSGEVVGMACVEVCVPSRFSDEAAVELSGVMVRPEARGLGLGAELVRACAAFARDRGIERVVLATFSQNTQATDWWEQMGFSRRVIQFAARAEDLLDPS